MDMAVNRVGAMLSVLSVYVLAGCGPSVPRLSVRREASPTSKVSVVPQLTRLTADRILLSWQSPLPGGGYTFEAAVQNGAQWSEVRTIAKGPTLSMFSADLPGVAALSDGKLLAMWEVKDERDGDRYATNIKTAASADEGRTWVASDTPYSQSFSGQHSFLSWFRTGKGIGLLWLDASARSEMRHGMMQHSAGAQHSDLGSVGLRYAALNADGRTEHEQFVNSIVCECCPTSAALTQKGPVVVYRGREEKPGTLPSEVQDDRPTVRDIYIARQEGGQWRPPHLVHNDNRVINGCPDNGPSVDAAGNRIAVAWWTRSNDQPKVQLAFSSDDGDSFGPAFRVDLGKGAGQVTVALLSGGRSAVVGWLENGETWARYVSESGAMSRPVALGVSPPHSRLPRWLTNGDGTVTAPWTSKREGSPHLEVSRIDLHSLN